MFETAKNQSDQPKKQSWLILCHYQTAKSVHTSFSQKCLGLQKKLVYTKIDIKEKLRTIHVSPFGRCACMLPYGDIFGILVR